MYYHPHFTDVKNKTDETKECSKYIKVKIISKFAVTYIHC